MKPQIKSKSENPLSELIDDEKTVDAFVKSCLSNTRNATRKKAEEFLRR